MTAQQNKHTKKEIFFIECSSSQSERVKDMLEGSDISTQQNTYSWWLVHCFSQTCRQEIVMYNSLQQQRDRTSVSSNFSDIKARAYRKNDHDDIKLYVPCVVDFRWMCMVQISWCIYI